MTVLHTRPHALEPVEFADQLKLAIFDWDGTVMDSISQIVASLLVVAQHYDVALQPESARHIIGLALPVAMQRLFPDHVDQYDAMREIYKAHYHAQAHAPVFAGFPEMLQALRARGVLLAVATGKNRPGLDRVLAQSGFEDLFVITRSTDEARSKPDPLMLQQILDFTGVPAHQAVMIGDTSFDLQMAHAAGMPSIGVLWGAHAHAELAACEPMLIAETVGQLSRSLGVI